MKGNLKNSPIPAYQLPHRKSKTYTVPEVIKDKVQNSKPTPFSLPKTKIESEADKLKNKFKKKSLEKGGKTPDAKKEKVKSKFKFTKKEKGGEMPKQGDTAAVYKKGVKIPEKKGKIDSSKWKK